MLPPLECPPKSSPHGDMNITNTSSLSAGPAISSPPVSPTVTQHSSRSPTPSPSNVRDHPRPSRSTSPRAQPEKVDVATTESADSGSQNVASRRPPLPAFSMSAPVGQLPRLLPHDTSPYTEAILPSYAVPNSVTSLSELAHLIRKQRYQEERRSHFRVRLHRWLVSAALSARLSHCGELAYRTLVDYFRSDQNDARKNFATLYNALHDVRSSCDATRRYALLEPELEHGRTKLLKADTTPSLTFMHEIPQKIRSELLEFLSELRNNPDFLAARVASLSQSELVALASFRPPLEPDSVMATVKGGTTIKKAHTNVPGPVERLLSFQRHDPLSALIYTIFASSAGPDSAEDLRRTEAWATVCARLIADAKQGTPALVMSVLGAWAGMRDWPAKTNIELYLMQVLQDGQFLLDKGDQAKPMSEKELIYATMEFFERSVKRLFDVIGKEPSAWGMPEGVWEIGIAIMRKVGKSKQMRHAAESLVVFRWFFSSFLPNAIIHPESHGIMMGYHISTQAREKILKVIASEAQKQASAVFMQTAFATPIMPEAKLHMEQLLNRLRHPRVNQRPVLLPAKAMTSPRETIEVHPYLVVCPSDIVTIVNSLFPERRPNSMQANTEFSRRGLASAASSISGISIPFRPASTPGDGCSVLSMSASSMTSDTTSREPLLHASDQANDSNEHLPSEHDISCPPRAVPTEEYGRRIRMACSEMTRILGREVTGGSCHPCAERWAVLYVTHDGNELRTRMPKDSEDENELEEDSPSSDSDDDAGQGMDLASDYHQLKDSIVKLLWDYELPKALAPESESKAFSNRITGHKTQVRPRALRRADPSNRLEDMPGGSLASQDHISNMLAAQRTSSATRPRRARSNSVSDTEEMKRQQTSDLVTMLESAYLQCQTRNEYFSAHRWFKTLEQLQKLTSPTLTRDGYGPLLNYFARGPRDSLSKCFGAIEHFEAWFTWLKQSQERYDESVEDMMTGFNNIRDKMWFKTAVLTSAGYEEARNIAVALKLMGSPPAAKTLDDKAPPTHKRNQFSRSSNNNFLLKTESQVMDLIATTADKAGPNKLVDEQAELTVKWIANYGIENFCKGEERIHRFCMEVDKCVNKLVGDGVLDAPVLWSSELYRRDREILDSGRQKGDLWLTGVGNLSAAGEEEYETASSRPVSRSLDFVQYPSQSSLRSVTTLGSQQSFDSSSKWSSGSRALNLMDAQDYFGYVSPALAIDSAVTFWSPFQTSGSPPSGNSHLRPVSGTSSRATVMLKNAAAVNNDKRKFLLDLKQNLTGLLLSDLGTVVFNNGSETDGWFSGDIGEKCIQRKEAEERRRKQKLARKKSMRSLKSAASREQRASTLETLGRTERSGPAPPVTTIQHADATHSGEEHNTSSSDATTRPAGLSAAKMAGLLEFPYNTAFQRLLDKFATHPNPFIKLHALYELELLIIASLSSKSGRYYNGSPQDTFPTVPHSPTLGSVPELSSRETAVPTVQARNLDEAIANVTERRSHSMSVNAHKQAARRGSPLPFRGSARSPHEVPSTDMIVDVLQSLFRDADIRPKTLFRDLQYIAAFVPASMLDKTARGKAFWDAGLAALGLKQDICRYMIEIADDIVAENTLNRSASHTGTTPTPESQRLEKGKMEDAAKMYIITAMEGDAVAERELAIFYLTHPDLLPRRVLPLSKPREIFKESLLNKKREDPNRSDPMTMCVAQHWMEMSKKGGDELATKYLRARDDMERIP